MGHERSRRRWSSRRQWCVRGPGSRWLRRSSLSLFARSGKNLSASFLERGSPPPLRRRFRVGRIGDGVLGHRLQSRQKHHAAVPLVQKHHRDGGHGVEPVTVATVARSCSPFEQIIYEELFGHWWGGTEQLRRATPDGMRESAEGGQRRARFRTRKRCCARGSNVLNGYFLCPRSS